jgi:tRNA(Ile)-lysidine synthase
VSTPSLQQRVRRSIERDALIPVGSAVLAAVSGGSDSVALLRLLLELAPGCGFTVAGVGHVNHGLRGKASEGDEAFCRRLAVRLGLPIEVQRRDVAALARARRTSIEAAAREARYEALAEMAARLGADLIATGHTRDDQAETFLLRLLRGAGSSGLSGIRPLRGAVVRPLLETRRQELRQYVKSIAQPFRDDASNRDTAIPRNWVRHRLLPLLARRLNGDIVEVLARQAGVLRDESALLDQMADDAARKVAAPGRRGALELDGPALLALPPAVARRIVRQALGRMADGQFLGASHVEAVLELAAGERPRGAADLPGARVERIGAGVVLYSRGRASVRALGAYRYALAVPGLLDLPECGCAIAARRRQRRSGQRAALQVVSGDRDMAVIDAAAARGGLAVRGRRPGDWIRPLGMRGRKKLQDVLVDRKVPRAERDRVPLVVDADDQVLWVAGHVVSHVARVTDSTRSMVVLKLIRNGEEGDEA